MSGGLATQPMDGKSPAPDSCGGGRDCNGFSPLSAVAAGDAPSGESERPGTRGGDCRGGARIPRSPGASGSACGGRQPHGGDGGIESRHVDAVPIMANEPVAAWRRDDLPELLQGPRRGRVTGRVDVHERRLPSSIATNTSSTWNRAVTTTMCRAPQVGLSCAILTIRLQRSSGRGGLPCPRDRQRQTRRKAWRCQRIRVAGCTMRNASRQGKPRARSTSTRRVASGGDLPLSTVPAASARRGSAPPASCGTGPR
jgi:hypothetical protein